MGKECGILGLACHPLALGRALISSTEALPKKSGVKVTVTKAGKEKDSGGSARFLLGRLGVMLSMKYSLDEVGGGPMWKLLLTKEGGEENLTLSQTGEAGGRN